MLSHESLLAAAADVATYQRSDSSTGPQSQGSEGCGGAGYPSALDYLLANRPYRIEIDPDLGHITIPELVAWDTHLPEKFDKPLLCGACLQEGRNETEALTGTLRGKLVPKAGPGRRRLVGLWKVHIVGEPHPTTLTPGNPGDFPSSPVATCPHGHYFTIPEYRAWARTDPDRPSKLGSASQSQLKAQYRGRRPPGAPRYDTPRER